MVILFPLQWHLDSEVALLYVNLVALWVEVRSSLWTVTHVECATDVDCGSMLSSHVHDQFGMNPLSLFWLKGCSRISVASCNRWYIYTSLLASTVWWQRQSQNFTHLLCINMTAYLRRLHFLCYIFFLKPDFPPTDYWQPFLLVLRLSYFLTIIIIIIISVPSTFHRPWTFTLCNRLCHCQNLNSYPCVKIFLKRLIVS